MSFHGDWWIRAEEIVSETYQDFIREKYVNDITDIKTEAIDKLQLELKQNKILETYHLSKPRIDMATQLIDFALKGDNK